MGGSGTPLGSVGRGQREDTAGQIAFRGPVESKANEKAQVLEGPGGTVARVLRLLRHRSRFGGPQEAMIWGFWAQAESRSPREGAASAPTQEHPHIPVCRGAKVQILRTPISPPTREKAQAHTSLSTVEPPGAAGSACVV